MRAPGNLQESEFKKQGEEYFNREFYDLLKELNCDEKEIANVKSIVIKKYIEMRQLGFSEYINLSELENLTTNTKISEINEIKKGYVKKVIKNIEKKIQDAVKELMKFKIEKFEKIYGSEWMYITSNEPDLVYSLMKILENGIKKEKCLEMINDAGSEYKNKYYKLISDSIKISSKDAESYFHVLMEILRINKLAERFESNLKDSENFFSKTLREKLGFLENVVERLNRVKHLDSLIKNKSIGPSELSIVKEFCIEQKKSLSDFLISSKNLKEVNFVHEDIPSATDALDSTYLPIDLLSVKTDSNVDENKDSSVKKTGKFLDYIFNQCKKNIKILSFPFYELSEEVKNLYYSRSSKGEKWFRIGVVFTIFMGLFSGLISFVFFSPTESLFYEDPILKVPVVLAFYWASAKVSSEIFHLTGSLYRAYERWRYGVEGHVEYILTEKAKSYFREMELQEIRNYFIREIGTYQRRLNKIKDKKSEEFNLELNVIKQLNLAWGIIQNGGIEQDRVKTVKAVQLCLKEIYKIRSSAYHNQFWQYDDGNSYNVLGVFMQNVKHAESMDLAHARHVRKDIQK